MPVDPATVEVEQVWYPSKDGTKISMFLVHKKGLVEERRARRRCSTATAASTSARRPAFSATRFQWFEDGGVYAVPNLRGGGEYGDAWHEAGMLGRKQNVFDDFIAAAEWLIANGYTTPSTARDLRRLERRPADRRARDAAAGALPGGDRRRAAARHAALPALPDGALLGARVRLGRERRPVRVPVAPTRRTRT